MPDKSKQLLFDLLANSGWQHVGDRIISPRETLSLDCDAPWDGTVQEYHRSLILRIKDLRDQQKAIESRAALQKELMDTVSLATCLGVVYDLSHSRE